MSYRLAVISEGDPLSVFSDPEFDVLAERAEAMSEDARALAAAGPALCRALAAARDHLGEATLAAISDESRVTVEMVVAALGSATRITETAGGWVREQLPAACAHQGPEGSLGASVTSLEFAVEGLSELDGQLALALTFEDLYPPVSDDYEPFAELNAVLGDLNAQLSAELDDLQQIAVDLFEQAAWAHARTGDAELADALALLRDWARGGPSPAGELPKAPDAARLEFETAPGASWPLPSFAAADADVPRAAAAAHTMLLAVRDRGAQGTDPARWGIDLDSAARALTALVGDIVRWVRDEFIQRGEVPPGPGRAPARAALAELSAAVAALLTDARAADLAWQKLPAPRDPFREAVADCRQLGERLADEAEPGAVVDFGRSAVSALSSYIARGPAGELDERLVAAILTAPRS